METQQNVSKQVEDHRPGRQVATHGLAAGIGGAVALILALLGRGAPPPRTDPQDPDHDLVSITSTALDRGDDYWAAHLEPRVWRMPHLVLIDHGHGETTPCGAASFQTGPFYCPPNERIYLDLEFLRAITGDLARAYVTAHELGHHVQKIRGEIAGRQLIDIELGADCYAGMWMHAEQLAGHLGKSDVETALLEAAAVGDDRLCPTCGQDLWKHGSSAQRVEAVKVGIDGGSCDQYRGLR
jgi:predicted metalloprotease